MNIPKYVKGLLTISETARRLQVARPTVYRWLERGKLSGTQIGGVIFVPEGEVERVKCEVEKERDYFLRLTEEAK